MMIREKLKHKVSLCVSPDLKTTQRNAFLLYMSESLIVTHGHDLSECVPLLSTQRALAQQSWSTRERHPHQLLLTQNATTQINGLRELDALYQGTCKLQQAIDQGVIELQERERVLQSGLSSLVPEDEPRLEILRDSLGADAFNKYLSKTKAAVLQVAIHLIRNGRNFSIVESRLRRELTQRKAMVRVKIGNLVVPPPKRNLSGESTPAPTHLELMTGEAFGACLRWLLGRFAEQNKELTAALSSMHTHFDQDGRGSVDVEEVLRTMDKVLPIANIKVSNNRKRVELAELRSQLDSIMKKTAALSMEVRNAIPQALVYAGLGLKVDPVSQLFRTLKDALGDVRCIWLDDNELTALKIHEEKQLPYLTTLSLSGNNIASFSGSVCQAFRALEILRISKNLLVELPEEISYCPHLREIHADNNRLKALPNALGCLTLLRVLYLHKNQLSYCPKEIFAGLQKLEELTLGHNLLESFELGSLSRLEVLHLQNNKFTSCPDISFKNFPNLKCLFLSENSLATLHCSVGSLSALEKLNISRNSLTELPDDFGGSNSLPNLTSIDCSFNQFPFVPIQLEQIRCLESINFQDNFLGTFTGEGASAPEAAEEEDLLGMDPCGLSFLPASLRYLNLRENSIRNLGEQSLDHLKELQDLHLQGNPLEDLPDCMADFENLKCLTVDIAGFQDSLYEVVSTGIFSPPDQEARRPKSSLKQPFQRSKFIRSSSNPSVNHREKERINENSQNIAKAVVAYLQWRRDDKTQRKLRNERLLFSRRQAPVCQTTGVDFSLMDEIRGALTSGKTFPAKNPTYWQYVQDFNLHPFDRASSFPQISKPSQNQFPHESAADLWNCSGNQHPATSEMDLTTQLLTAQHQAFHAHEQSEQKPVSASTFLLNITPIGSHSRPNSRPLFLRISKHARVSQVKRLIADNSGIAEADQVLIFGSQTLADDNMIGSYNGIQNQAEVGLLVATT
mmetsp:Transcript_29993/g.38506  ORF Transcript_29993/g.38506 Transcript_29993/m.38506 type:complete len:964 (-) Transcript_29993:219-3110(-)